MKKISHGTFGSMSVFEQQRTYPSPNPSLTLICYKLTVVRLREGYVRSCSDRAQRSAVFSREGK